MTERKWADSTPIVPFGGLHGSGNDKTQFERIVELERDLAARDAELRYVRETLDKALPGMDEGAPIEAIARKVAAHIAAREAELAELMKWKEAVINELIVAHIYSQVHDDSPRKAVHDAITWNCQVALDPAVSSDAQRLRDTYLQRAVAAEQERDSAVSWNHRVSVCEKHTAEIVDGPCVICELEAAERKAEEYKAALNTANDSCRSAYQVANRAGAETDWENWKFALQKSLKEQHKVMYPEQYTEERRIHAHDAAIAAKGEA